MAKKLLTVLLVLTILYGAAIVDTCKAQSTTSDTSTTTPFASPTLSQASAPANLDSSLGSSTNSDWPMFHADPSHSGSVTGNASSTLSLLWKYQANNDFDSSPAVVNGTVYEGCMDGNIFALNAITGEKLWSYTADGFVDSSPAVANGVVYFGTGHSLFYALNEANGNVVWTCSVRSPNSIQSSPTIVGSVVYFGCSDGNVYALDAATGAKLWSYAAGNMVVVSPAVSNGVVYVGSLSEFFALNATTGACLWACPFQVASSAAVVNGIVYFGSNDGNIYALDASTGTKIWSYPTLSSVSSSPAVANGVVYVGSWDNNYYALDASTGAEIWTFKVASNVTSSPAVVNGIVYACSGGDGMIYSLNAQNGQELSGYHAYGAFIDSSPAFSNGVIYVGCGGNAEFYALGAYNGPTPILTPTPSPPPPYIPTVSITPGSWTMDVGQSEILTATASAGTRVYLSYNWYVNGVFQSNTNGATFVYTPNSADSASITVTVTDSSGETSPLSAPSAITTNPTMNPPVATSSATAINVGQRYTVSISTNVRGGTPPFIYDWLWAGPAIGEQFHTCCGKNYILETELDVDTNSSLYNGLNQVAVPGYQYELVVTDNSSDPVTTTSNVVSVTVNGPIPNATLNPTQPLQTPSPTPTQTQNPTPPTTQNQSPTYLNLSCGIYETPPTFKIEIDGSLSSKNAPLSNAPILISYSTINATSWNNLTTLNTDTEGGFSTELTSPTAANYLIKATYTGNTTYASTNATTSITIAPASTQNPQDAVIAVSNSTVTNFNFNPTNNEINLNVQGPTGSTGYTDIYITKTLAPDATKITATLDGKPVNFTKTSDDSIWILTFTYHHSTHTIAISINQTTRKPHVELTPIIIVSAVIAATLTTTYIVGRKGIIRGKDITSQPT